MINKQQLEKLIKRYDAKAEAAYQKYQETGITRYDREKCNAEDLADALRAALAAHDEHEVLGHLRGEMVWLASRADKALDEHADRDVLASLLESLIAYAVTICHYQKRDHPSENGGVR